ncbi:response regulator [Sphingosinicella sp. BN140058]|uniref:response regulator n=1 Tax=Sphingosinicella sp. BN140058 TaxID=1892855 RepID=UPI0010107DF0|nr:response regulator [Sphingosinicella sp. BN140058]QAY78122.1 response regulator [Sphingosinicella sp. BN140058]
MRVLFVEDDPMNRRVVKDMLSVAGAQMAEAEDAESGLRMIEEESFNVILMDLRMPGMDGMTAIKRIREREDDKAGLPVIVVTADTGARIREDCMENGADEVILKPVAMKALFDAMGKMIVRHAKRAAA